MLGILRLLKVQSCNAYPSDMCKFINIRLFYPLVILSRVGARIRQT